MRDSFTFAGHRLVLSLSVLLLAVCAPVGAQEQWVTYEAKDGPGKGKHVVLLSGDEEYRSEEGLPMLAKILSQRHGFKCTVLFPVDPDGTINPNNQKSLPGAQALDTADAIVMALRFRNWPEEQMKHFADAYKRGVPVIGLRTSTHAFANIKGQYADFNNFGKKVLGEQWVSHWGRHGSEATRGVIEPAATDHPLLRGVGEVFGDSDVYEAYPPADATILMRGVVVKGMKSADPPADYRKKRSTDKQEQGVNDPMMPIAWTRTHKNEAGKENKIFCTTMGAATDLQSEGLRRMVVNAVYWGVGLEVPAQADVNYVGEYKPTPFKFNGFKKGVKPSDHRLKEQAAAVIKAADIAEGGDALTLNKADHVAIIGNAFADRMQHFGWLESYIHARFPEHELVFRNLAVAGDEVAFRHRSENFGTPDEWLTKVKADVILAFFGFNESFKGREGLEKFKADLDKFIKDTKRKNYSGKGAPKLVLVSPVAAEKHRNANVAEAAARNPDIALYAAAMAEVAKANGVALVDLFEPSQRIYADAARENKSLTVNGWYQTEEGDKLLAGEIFRGLFDESPPDVQHLDKLRAAVNQKNWQWHQRYRTVDGYNVYGGRSRLAFEQGKGGPKLDNYTVMQQEMRQRDVLTANRDKVVWAAARRQDLKPDDSNLPPVTQVITNKPGPKPDGSHEFVDPEEAIALMKVHPGCKVNLFADEKQFPELIKPVQMAWDTEGRLWVAAWPSYPERTPTSTRGDSLLVLEDTDGDGKADKCTPFLTDLNSPTGFQFYKDGVLVMQAPDLWFVRDTDGDGKADWKERVLMGIDSADSHHTTNAMAYDPGGAIYLSDGVFHRTQVETARGVVRNNDAAIFRFEPITGRFETYVSYAFANPHGRVFDYWGNDLITDATGNNTYFGAAFSGHIDYPQKHKSLKQFWERPSRPCPHTGLLTSRHFPDDWQGIFLNLNVISFQGVYRVKIKEEGSGLWGETLPDLVSSKDPNFRPICIATGPDGAIYLADWHNPIIGHMQHHIRDPNRDHVHGRIYRITYEGRPLMKPAKIDGQPVEALLELLKEPENQTRELAKIELHKHDSAKVAAAAKQWAAKLDKSDRNYEHHMMEALWVHQWHNVVDVELLGRMLKSPEPRARAAAARVLCYWRDRVPNVVALLKAVAEDEHPRVRLEGVRAASFFRTAEAADIALATLKHPMDYYLEYALGETMRQVEPYWRKALAEGKPVAADNPAGIRYLMRTASATELLKLPRTPAVIEAILQRPEVTDAVKSEVLTVLAEQKKMSRAAVLLGMIGALDKSDATSLGSVSRLLPLQPTQDLQPVRERLLSLATAGPTAEVRQAAWGALALADDSFDKAWTAASKSPKALVELLNGIPMIYAPDVRAKAYGRVMPLLAPDLPADLAAALKGITGGVSGRYVRVELPRRGTLTLAEVQVMSGGKNIARNGAARQSTTAHGGEASLAIDGRTDGAYSSGTQTHTQEDRNRPWWELDLGGSYPIESIVVWNRSEGNGQYANRLEGFTLTVFDAGRKPVFTKAGNQAPSTSATFALGDDTPGALRRAAVAAAVSMQAEQESIFLALANLVEKNQHVVAAARGIRTLPRNSWDKPRSAVIARSLVDWAKSIPADQRTSHEYLEAVQLAGDLAGLLPAEQSAALRKELKDLRVAVFVLTAVREQMRYDSPRLVVEAGKPFEIIFENTDFMPHNLVVVNPGMRPKIGELSAAMTPDQLDGQGRAFIPKSSDVLAATRLLEAGQREALKMTAPSKEGTYDYVCTYPGHWELMWGRLIVTNDVDAYLQANPDAGSPVPAKAGAKHEHH